jgi:probable F420-dependent oxidoreductase
MAREPYMKIGIRYSDTELENFVTIAVAADDAGIESLWRGEHILVPRVIKSIDPYYARALPPGMECFPSLDPITLAAFLAAKTKHLRFCMGVNLIALHNPYQLARVVATADVVSNGRIMMAVGAGWLREEFDIMGIDWATRGSRCDEAIEVLRTLWCDPHSQFQGKHFSLPPVTFNPKPVQKPRPPILVAGLSPAAIRRAVRHGDGWYGHDLSLEEVASIVKRIEGARESAGMMDHPFGITTRAKHSISSGQVLAFESLGVERLVLDVGSAAVYGLPTVLARIEAIGRELVDLS